jgi:hypothetical protein
LLTVSALTDKDAKNQLDEQLSALDAQAANLSNGVRCILNSDRDEESLVDHLNWRDSIIISTVLQGIADPSTLSALLGDE